MKVIAHRGASAEAEENTLLAFARALEVGADMIELDLRLTSDGVVFVAHDPVGDAGRRRRWLAPSRPSWEEVRALGAAGGRYPSLGEVLDGFAAKIALNLEIKELAAVAPLLKELGRRRLGEGILLSSFDRRAMPLARRLAPHVPRGYLCVRPPVRLAAALAGSQCATFHLRREAVTARAVARAHQAGVPVYVWTVDDAQDLRRLHALGVDGVFTNDPRRAREVFPR